MARLPQPGGDNGNWGDILNDYLSQSHTSDGTLKDNSVTAAKIADGSISEASLDTGLQTKVNSSADKVTKGELLFNPLDYGAVGDGAANDTAAMQAAVAAAEAAGGGTLLIPRGKTFSIPGNLYIASNTTVPVNILGYGGVITGGEVVIGPAAPPAQGVKLQGMSIAGVVFDRKDAYGSSRALVLRGVRGVLIEKNFFKNTGKCISASSSEGVSSFHCCAMIRISRNHFSTNNYAVWVDTTEWDYCSDWTVEDNYFNYSLLVTLWFAAADNSFAGGIDGLVLQGNTIFTPSGSPTAQKTYILRMDQTDWLHAEGNQFFGAGLSAVYLVSLRNAIISNNHFAWPGEVQQADAIEIHDSPNIRAIIEGNTFAYWTRAAIGIYSSELKGIEIGSNRYDWSASPANYYGATTLTTGNCYRIYADSSCTGVLSVRGFNVTSVYDNLKGNSRTLSRDARTSTGGISGGRRPGLPFSGATPVTVFNLADIMSTSTSASLFSGLIVMRAQSTTDTAKNATYLLFVSSQGNVCTTMQAAGLTSGSAATDPSFTFSLSANLLQATPVGSTTGSFTFIAESLGALSLA